MKKAILILLAFAMAFGCLAGFSTAKTVPDLMLQWVVEDFVKENQHVDGWYTEYSYEVTHSPDKSTNTDTVTIRLTMEFPHSVRTATYEGTYQYNKTTDLWSFLRGDEWSGLKVKSYDITSSSTLWIDSFRQEGWENVEFRDDLDPMIFLGDFDVEKPESFWTMYGRKEYDDGTAELSVSYFRFPTVSDAETCFSALCDYVNALEGFSSMQIMDSRGESAFYRGESAVYSRNKTEGDN